jgi:hypothetical protein
MRTLFGALQTALANPVRHPRTAVVIGRLLGSAFIICFLTGLYSHFIQDPLPWMWFPSRPVSLYRVTQALHVITGIACIPLLLAKLYTVYPLLFKFPPVDGLLAFLERASITVFVGGALVELASGLMNINQLYTFPFTFRQTHYALAWILIASLIIHIGTKLPVIRRWWFKRRSVDEQGELLPVGEHEGELGRGERVQLRGLTGRVQRWFDAPPTPTQISRRTMVGATAAGVAVISLATAGEAIPALNGATLFAPRQPGSIGPREQRLPINKTAREARVIEQARDPEWQLTIKHGERSRTFTRAELQRLPQHTVKLPIACVEGWSKSAVWTGVRVRDLMRLVGAEQRDVIVQSLQRGAYARTILEANFVQDPLSLIALRVNGEELSLDHGYPARLIAPARPGVLQTKWLSYLEAR